MKTTFKVKIFLLRLRRVLIAAFKQLYTRVLLSAFIRGVKLPGLTRVKSRLPPEVQAAVERRMLVREIKQQRYSFQFGPLWFRSAAQRLLVFTSRNRVWATLALKMFTALLVVLVIGGLFILIRGVLPVPERVPGREASIRLRENSNQRTEWLYTEPPFVSAPSNLLLRYNTLKNNFRYTSILPFERDNAPLGLYHFGIGDYARRVQLLRGFVVSERSPLLVPRQRSTKIDIAGKNRLQISYHLFPAADGKKNRCRLRVRDENDNLLLNSELMTPELKAPVKGFVRAWRQRFTPDAINPSSEVQEFTVDTDNPPAILKFDMQLLGNSNEPAATAPVSDTETMPVELDNKIIEHNGSRYIQHDASKDSCVGAIANISFESTRVKPLQRRGLLFILVDTMRAQTSEDVEIMPNLNQFRKKSLSFYQHRAQSNMTVPSVTSLMFSLYPREVGPVAFSYAPSEETKNDFYGRQLESLPTLLSKEGYRTAAFGNVSLFTQTIEGGIDFGFHDATLLEASEYEARHITEDVGDWLERYGDAPFFIYAHYHTMHGPYRPPFQYLDVLSYLKNPIGRSGSASLYNSLGQFWDSEFALLQQRLADLGILNKIDIIVTSDHGAQLEPRPYGQFLGIPSDHVAATTDKGHSLTDEEVRVPFIAQFANAPELIGQDVRIPSAHVDVLPTIASLYIRETETTPARWRGLSWFLPSQAPNLPLSMTPQTVVDNLESRTSMYFDAMRYTSLFNYGGAFKNRPTKYIRQLATDRAMLYFDKFPYRRREQWFTQEMTTKVDFKNRSETWQTSVDAVELAALRKEYFQKSPSPRELRLTPLFDGPLILQLNFQVTDEFHLPSVLDVPGTLQVQILRQENVFTIQLSGTVEKGKDILISKNGAQIESIQEQRSHVWVSCTVGAQFGARDLVHLLKSDAVCTYQPIPGEVLMLNVSDKPTIAVQNQLSWDTEAHIEMSGAGAALREALKDWGYAK